MIFRWMIVGGFAFIMAMIATMIMLCVPDLPRELKDPGPDPAKVNARNIEVLREILEDETGKQITFMAEERGPE